MRRFIAAIGVSFSLFTYISPATSANLKNMLCDDEMCIDMASRKEVMMYNRLAPFNPVTLIDTYTPNGRFDSTLEVDCGSVQIAETEDGGLDSIVNIRPHDGSEVKWYGAVNGVIQEVCADQD